LIVEPSSAPEPDVDLSVFVLAAVDDHLADFQRIRDLLSSGGPVDAGGRRALAVHSAALAGRYAARMSSALDLTRQPYATSVP
jgi:hypothetical protein